MSKFFSFLKNLTENIGQDDITFTKGCLSMRKGDGDSYYLMCQFSNRWRDRDAWSAPHKGGEIITSDAHREFMAYLDKTPDLAPALWSYHIPGTARGKRAHWWDFDGDFAYMEFELTREEAEGVKRFTELYEPGLSHGFFVMSYDVDQALIKSYLTYEVSILPREMAANQWTTFGLLEEGAKDMKFSPEKRQGLVALHGEPYVRALEEKTVELAGMLDKVGIDTKGLGLIEDEPAAPVAVPVAAPVAAPVDVKADQSDILAALTRLSEVLGGDIKALSAQLSGLITRVEAIEKVDQEKVKAQVAAAPQSIFAQWMPVSVIGNVEAQLDGRSSLAKSGPEENLQGGNHMLAGMLPGGGRNGR